MVWLSVGGFVNGFMAVLLVTWQGITSLKLMNRLVTAFKRKCWSIGSMSFIYSDNWLRIQYHSAVWWQWLVTSPGEDWPQVQTPRCAEPKLLICTSLWGWFCLTAAAMNIVCIYTIPSALLPVSVISEWQFEVLKGWDQVLTAVSTKISVCLLACCTV
jgi:hypothetical protein